MATYRKRTNYHYTLVGSTRYLTINSSLATEVVLKNGFSGIRLFNGGSTPLVWGDSNITVNSGNYLYPSAFKEWEEVQDGFSFFVFSDSNGTSGIAVIQEYRP